jgi:gamma-butyrobetaine dioxygenase
MADLDPMRTEHQIVRLEHEPAAITLIWDDGRRSRHHALWLRDHCACPECRHPQALERKYMFLDHPRPAIAGARLLPDGVAVDFISGGKTHSSEYATGWLRSNDQLEKSEVQQVRSLQLWGSELASALARIDFDEYMATSPGLRRWIETLQTCGIVMLENVPCEPGELLEVAHRIGPVRSSNFGEYYDVVSMPNPNASAYTDMGLELHTDLANWRMPPDIQLLCCLKNSVAGGESVFVDGFKIAADLRTREPAAFDLLSTTPIDFRFHDESCDIRTRAPTIELDGEGGTVRIRFNNWLRGATTAPEEQIEPLYAALDKFWRMLRDPQNRLNLRLEPGQLIAYNNHRVLHGRAPFDGSSGERHLQGCYLNLEDLESTLRVLKRALP